MRLQNNCYLCEMKKDKKKLNLKQKQFCKLYVSSEFFANGVQSYIEAYNIDLSKDGAYRSAINSAFNLLTKADILLYINELLELTGLNNTFVDKQMELLITQNADFGSKLGAIKEYNKLKSRVTEKIEHSGKIINVTVEDD